MQQARSERSDRYPRASRPFMSFQSKTAIRACHSRQLLTPHSQPLNFGSKIAQNRSKLGIHRRFWTFAKALQCD
jgi:hypothetical protein